MIREQLFALRDEKYALFQSRLIPGFEKDQIIGVRVPLLRKLAKDIWKNNREEAIAFMNDLPHTYYDENMLHGLLIAEIRDFKDCVSKTEAFLPYVDNWAVCDCFSPKCFLKQREELLPFIKKWIDGEEEYGIRYGIRLLMNLFLDEEFKPEYLKLVSSINSDKYYVQMMVAWYFATALAKQYDASIGYLEDGLLAKWVHNKTIQKAVESFRISDERKIYLKTLRK